MIRLLIGDISKLRDVEVIVSAANGIGVAGAGVAGAIARAGGENYAKELREKCRSEGPFEPGQVFETESGVMKKMGIQAVYHAVTMKYPGTQSSLDNVVKATRSACLRAISGNRKSIAFPGLGTGIGGLDKKTVAHRMATILFEYEEKIAITVVDRDEQFVLQVKEALASKREKEDVSKPKQADFSFE